MTSLIIDSVFCHVYLRNCSCHHVFRKICVNTDSLNKREGGKLSLCLWYVFCPFWLAFISHKFDMNMSFDKFIKTF